MQRQGVHSLFPCDRIDTDYWRLARQINRGHNRVEFCHIEIALELFARLPVLDEQQGLPPIQI